MIIEFYPNPNKSKNDAPLVITPTYTTKNTSFNQYQAERRGITVTEFLRRDALIRKAIKDITYKVGDSLFPFNKDHFEKKGKCRILHIASSYSQLEKDYQWDEDKPLFLVQAIPEKGDLSTFFATPGFFRWTEPNA